MNEKLSKCDIADYLTDDESMTAYLNAIMEEDDQDLLLAAIGDIAKAKGMSQIAEQAGLGRESLYKALSPGAHPRFDTIRRVLHALGLGLTTRPIKPV